MNAPRNIALRRPVVPTLVLIFASVLGVVLMHSVAMVPSAHAQPHDTHHHSVPVHVEHDHIGGDHDPGAHHGMHPCVATTASWPGLVPPPLTAIIDLAAAVPANHAACTDAVLERAPPPSVPELDRSVLLRV